MVVLAFASARPLRRLVNRRAGSYPKVLGVGLLVGAAATHIPVALAAFGARGIGKVIAITMAWVGLSSTVLLGPPAPPFTIVDSVDSSVTLRELIRRLVLGAGLSFGSFLSFLALILILSVAGRPVQF
ncbi:hypothetical protein [Muricoccus radiodurans]|uniref:hypothetical protein n=1 Tax=Muricoccus radiodurans TaxID=2231721 RepID=UPI003CFAC18E